MSTTFQAPPEKKPWLSPSDEQRIILHDISWKTYQQLLDEFASRSSPSLAYNQGTLEIMSPSSIHERISGILCDCVKVVAEMQDLDIEDFGKTTLKREDLKHGVEPDGSFYIKNPQLVRHQRELDLSVDPPPDLAIEVDVTSGSLNKFPIYKKIGVPEIWHHSDKGGVSIHHLEPTGYVKHSGSLSFPQIMAEHLQRTVDEFLANGRSAALKVFRSLMTP